MSRWDEITDAASGRHLSVLGALHPTELPDVQTLVMLGPREPGFWAMFRGTAEFRDGAADPMDRWSTRVIGTLATELGATPYFPFGGPPFQPFIRWATETGRSWPSPIGLLVHDTAGLMISYRGALGFAERLDIPPQPERPCVTCVDQPCLTACPIGALGADGYDVDACKSHLRSDAGTECMQGCLVRRACPISKDYGRLPEHSHFHMKAFR